MNPETRYSAHWIVGQQGMGKTNLLLHMLASDLQERASIIIVDAKGDLTGPIRKLNLGDRLIVLDPRQSFAINPLDVSHENVTQASDQLLYIFGALLEADVTSKQEAFLRPLLRAIVTAHPNPTLATLQHVITNGPKGQFTELAPDLREFFEVEWADYATTRNELKWRMRLLLDNPLIRRLFSAPKTRLHLSEAMDTGKVIVVDNSQAVVGKAGSTFLGRYIVSQVWEAATARANRRQEDKLPVYVYVDEAQLVIDEKIAAIIDECRSQRIALVLSHQRKGQIKDSHVLSALENCAIKMANVDAEASYFSDLLHIPEERINRLPRGHFGMHVRGEGSSIVEVPRAELPFSQMTLEEELQLTVRMQSLYGITAPPPPLAPEPVIDSPPPTKTGESDSAAEW
jgi:type IV secretory pathway VirB4 component